MLLKYRGLLGESYTECPNPLKSTGEEKNESKFSFIYLLVIDFKINTKRAFNK